MHDEPGPLRPETVAARGVRAPAPEDLPVGLRSRPHVAPLQPSSAYDFENVPGSLRPLGGREGYAYARYGHPNGREVELTMAALEGAEDSVATASGMAAISSTVLAFAGAGDRVVVQSDAYGGTLTLLREDLSRLGIEVVRADAHDPAAITAALRSPAALLLVESLSNPLLRRVDLPALARVCKGAGTRLVVDATFSSPVLCTPLNDGADIVLHSGTKFLGGHHDLTLGVVSGMAADMGRVRRTAVHLGGRVAPFDAWLCARGLKTLALRVERSCATAATLAARLHEHPAVHAVHHPGECALVTLDVGSQAAAFGVAAALRLVTLTPSLGGVTTTVSHPPTSSHAALTPEERAAIGVADGLLRLSCGIEHVDDLWDDLRQALSPPPCDRAVPDLVRATMLRSAGRRPLETDHMDRHAFALFLLPGLLVACGGEADMTRRTQRITYPVVARDHVVETLHGVEVADPYRWLEDLDGEATLEFVEAQNAVTAAFLAKVPEREAIRRRLTHLWDHERYDVPFRRGGRTFYRHNDGLLDQSLLYVQDRDGAEPRVLIDPNSLSKDGTVALGDVSPSPDGALVAYAVQGAGSDWITWRVRDVATAQDRTDTVEWAKFSGASWARDASGFYYSRYDVPASGEEYESTNENQRLWFHVLGTDQSADRLVLEDAEHPKRGFGGRVTDDGAYLVISVWEGTKRENRVHYVPLSEGREGGVVRLLDEADAQYEFVGNVGTRFVVKTDLDAPRGRVLAIDVARPARENWVELIPQSAETLRDVTIVGERLVCEYLRDAHSHVRLHTLDGSHAQDVELPGIGSAMGFRGRPGDPITYFAFSGFTTPTEIHRLDTGTGEMHLFRRVELPVDRDAFETRQVFYESKDGTRIPMFLTHRKGLVLDGKNPTLLYGYGGFDIPLTPGFSVSNLVWMEMGGVYAVANLRGGGEYGEEWHAAGTKERKQNVFDDFIAAADWLIAQGYTSTPKLAIMGGSNGGLLVGACMTQRPDLFGACIPAVGVLDMLRFHEFTIGWAWVSDYGSPDDPADFAVLRSYSPYHNLREGERYPATMIVTGDHDDRVVPSHSFKFAAALQHAQGGDAPCLIRIETRAGHGAGKPVSKQLEEVTDRWAFLAHVLDMRVQLPTE